MAPALTVTPQYNHYDAVEETEKLSHRRRALASVDNVSIPMEEDDMGLQNQPSLAKDSQEMEQILVDLGNNDLVQADLLQAIKTLESGGDSLSTGDPDGMFPLSGFDLADTVDSESDATEDKIRLIQARLERRCAFLLRRLRILQARAIGKRISEEASQTFEKCAKGARRDGGGRPMGLKALLKRIETTAALQASAASRSVVGPKYYRAGTSKGDASRSASIGIPSGTLTGLEDSAGALRSHLSVVKHQLDSDATASSSGAESNDEAVTYNNTHQQPMPIIKFLLIKNKVREAKGPVEFEVSGESQFEDTCSRVRPLRRDTFNKRKLLQMHNLHIATNKAAKPSDINCRCVGSSCAVCTGRFEATQPAAPSGMLPPAARRALVDPSHHPVLSDVNDLRPSVHLSALTSRSWFRSRVTKSWRGAHTGTAPRAPPAPPPRHRRLTTSMGRGRSSTENRLWRRQSYDIDNIVIPQSVAASTRPEILTYKEIITPKWRVMEIPETPLNNGVSKSNRMSIESDDEDISEAAVQARHTRAETRERNRYLRKRRSRRRNTEEENNDPIPEVVVRQPTPPLQETVPPYSPRQFPLKDDLYQDMLSKMPEGYRPISPDLDPDITMEEDTSSLSPLSPLNFDGDDPDDAEWNPSNEKSDKRRSTLR
ncbi:hypothetical protein KGM_203277 [Danaus plexippus plexippus]|uniref:PEHE domain-containing protein n=1 Tax=Danaus plexippus plexippus TaxID=278856 RepID=A0A212EYR8_DANPL|nr:hypothetical protein KGM_203277 [Danaus plexippus plexippus]